MSVDDNLLENNADEDEDFSFDDQAEEDGQIDDQAEEEAQIGNQGRSRDDKNDSPPQSLREARIMERARAGSQGKEELKKTAEAEVASKLLTLCFSFKTLTASWGLSALYGNVHLFLKYTINDKLRSLSLKESMILALVDVIVILLIIIQVAIIALIVGFFDNPLKAIKNILESVFTNWKNIK